MENLQCGGRGGGNPNSDFFGKYVKRAKKGHFYLSVFLPIWAVSKCQLILDSSLKHKRGKGDSKEWMNVDRMEQPQILYVLSKWDLVFSF